MSYPQNATHVLSASLREVLLVPWKQILPHPHVYLLSKTLRIIYKEATYSASLGKNSKFLPFIFM